MIKNGMTISKEWVAKKEIIRTVYKRLLDAYGPQGWWPLINYNGINPTKTGYIKGYHPGDYRFPLNKDQQFEISIGAILTQNTAWPNVEKALNNLNDFCSIQYSVIKDMDDDQLKGLIRPAGFFNQKSRYIKSYCQFFNELKGHVPTRKELLSIKGIGEETADSILLYAFKVPTFVIDAYTKRIFLYLGIISGKEKYRDIKRLFEDSLESDCIVYQEYHALIVEHAKRYYSKAPYGIKDSLLNEIIVTSK